MVRFYYHTKGEAMSDKSVRSTVRRCLKEFLESTGRPSKEFGDDTNLTRDLGLTSDEGIDFVLDLCRDLHVELPKEFNPFVHESGHRGLRVSEMIARVKTFVSRTGAAA
jgi:hypothetical protein